LESAVGYLGREGLGGDLDATFKSLMNLVPFMGKQIETWDVAQLSQFQQNEIREKLIGPAPDSDSYNWDLPALQGVEVADDFKSYWGQVANKAGASQEQFAAFIEANQQFLTQQGEQAAQLQTDALQAQKDANTEHFKGEWGDAYEYNKTLVDGWIADNLDMQNADDRMMVFNPKALDMIHRLALAEKQGRSEPTIADGGEGGSHFETAQAEYETFLADHPEYQNDLDAKVRREGARLRDLAFAARKRARGA
jgi:hypothetical protein